MPLVTYTDFSGGVNQQLPPIILDGEQGKYPSGVFFCEDILNWEASEAGLLKHEGYASVLNTAFAGGAYATGKFDWNGTLITCTSAGKIYSVSGGVATEIFTGNTAGAYFYQAVEFLGVLLLMNGINSPVQYNGTTATTVTFTDPNAIWGGATPQGAAVKQGRIFYWGDPTLPHRVYAAVPGQYNDFTVASGADAFDVDKGYGGVLTGIAVQTDQIMVIFKQDAVRRLSGTEPVSGTDDPFIIRPVTDALGCIAPRSVVNVGQDIYFLSSNGLRSLSATDKYGNIAVGQPSLLIQDTVNTFNRAAYSNACAVFNEADNSIYLSVPTGSSTTNEATLVYDVITNTMQPRTGFSVACWGYVGNRLYHGDYAGQIYRHGGINSYNGTAINGFWKSKFIAHDGMTLKRYKRLIIYFEGDGDTSLGIRWGLLRGESQNNATAVAGITGGSLWDSAVWDQDVWDGSGNNVFDTKNLGRGRAIKLEFLNNGLAERPKIRQINLLYEVLGVNKG